MIAVTGGTGHIGNVLVRQLLASGESIRVMKTPHDDPAPLAGLAVELVDGDVRDRRSLEEVLTGADLVFHLAGQISISPGKTKILRQVNIEGTRNMVSACLRTGVRRLVYTSSVHAFNDLPHGMVIDEATPIEPERVMGAYGKSKALATLAVLDGVRRGLDAVIVHPSGVIGPYDYRLSEMGGLIVDVARGRMKAFIDGAYDFVDVRDVAAGVIEAAARGKKGESYILAGEALSVREFLALAGDLAGVKPPSLRVPNGLARAFAALTPLDYAFSKTKPRFTSYSLKVLASNSQLSSEKARRELAYAPRPLAQSVRDSIEWFRIQGVIPRRAGNYNGKDCLPKST